MKRDNWTNEEVIDILEGMKMVVADKTDGLFNGLFRDVNSEWNTALDSAISQFRDFKRPVDQYAAMAYEPDTKEIVVVGPPLPR